MVKHKLIYRRIYDKSMAKLKIIGTSHIAPESLAKVEKIIIEEKPQIVAIELDKKRFYALITKQKSKPSIKDIKRIGFKGWLFALLGSWVEHKLGAKVGISPGAEMLKAAQLAHQTGAKLALIDQDIEITLKRFSKALSWKEKFTFIGDIFKGIFFKKGIQFDLTKVPSQKVIEKLIEDVKKRYPNIYRVLIQERNEYMAKRLAQLIQHYPESNIIAVVGAGHEKEIRKMLNRIQKP